MFREGVIAAGCAQLWHESTIDILLTVREDTTRDHGRPTVARLRASFVPSAVSLRSVGPARMPSSSAASFGWTSG
eukprot:7381217-Prymnesium_polylepis.2